jgi:hypothetical protein
VNLLLVSGGEVAGNLPCAGFAVYKIKKLQPKRIRRAATSKRRCCRSQYLRNGAKPFKVALAGPQYRRGVSWFLGGGGIWKRAAFSIKRRQRIFIKEDAPPAFDGSLAPSSKIKMMTQADRQGYIVNVTIQVEWESGEWRFQAAEKLCGANGRRVS